MDVSQIILIVVIVLLVIAYPILVSSKNKKERKKLDEQTNSLKRGDKVMTTSGVVGTIVDLVQEGERKIVTIETGSGKNKGYTSVDAYAIYAVLNNNFEPIDQTKTEKKEDKKENKKAEKQTAKVEEKSLAQTVENEKTEIKPTENKTSEDKVKKSQANKIETSKKSKW